MNFAPILFFLYSYLSDIFSLVDLFYSMPYGMDQDRDQEVQFQVIKNMKY